MEFWTVTLVGLAAGLVLVIGGALVIYMGSLVKSAYQLKIEIKSEVDEGQRRLEEEVEKKIRWIKRDLVEEVDKVKDAMQTDNQRKIQEILAGFITRLTVCEESLLTDRTETAKLLEGLRNDVIVLDQRLRLVRREQKAAQTASQVDDVDGAPGVAPAVPPPQAAEQEMAPPPAVPETGEGAAGTPA
jgi:hypothetical protein